MAYDILAYVTLEKDRAQDGALILIAKDVDDQKQLCADLAKALHADVVGLRCGDYMVIRRQ